MQRLDRHAFSAGSGQDQGKDHDRPDFPGGPVAKLARPPGKLQRQYVYGSNQRLLAKAEKAKSPDGRKNSCILAYRQVLHGARYRPERAANTANAGSAIDETRLE